MDISRFSVMILRYITSYLSQTYMGEAMSGHPLIDIPLLRDILSYRLPDGFTSHINIIILLRITWSK